jgi:hypothetical protein
MLIEKTGIAATAIITDRFVATAQAVAQASGRPGLPFAVIPHPISHNTDAELRAKAASAVEQCMAMLTQPAAAPHTMGPHARASVMAHMRQGSADPIDAGQHAREDARADDR